MEDIKFRTQAPQDLCNRIFALDYLRKLGPKKVYEGLTEELRKEKYFYSFQNSEGEEIEVDFNWERLTFKTPMNKLEEILEIFIDDIEKIDEKELEELRKLHEAEIESQAIADINIMDIAKAEIARMKDPDLLHLGDGTMKDISKKKK